MGSHRAVGNSPPNVEEGTPFGQGIAISCDIDDGVVIDLEIEPRLTPRVDRLLAGKPPEAVTPLLGALFSLCRHAHTLAASQALGMAQGKPLSPEDLRRARMLRDLEIIREHGLNLFQSSPRGLVPPDSMRGFLASVQALCLLVESDPQRSRQHRGDGLASEVHSLRCVLQAFFGAFWTVDDPGLDELLGWAGSDRSPAGHLLRAALRPGWAEFGACASAFLPLLEVERLEQILVGDSASAFIRKPSWEGAARETTCFSRQAGSRLIVEASQKYGNGLLARTLARMVEMKRIFEGLARMDDSISPGLDSVAGRQGVGVAQVEASRGRLIHLAVVEAGRVKDYRILAPTEWNFHPSGLVRRALVGASAPTLGELRSKIQLWLRSIDPCVHFDLSLVSREPDPVRLAATSAHLIDG